MSSVADDILMHYGMPRRSGRYPWGSGEDPYQHGRDFLGRIEELKKTGWTETAENVKAEFGIGLREYRAEKAKAKNERQSYQINTAKRLMEKEGMGYTEIGRELGVPESTVRGWFKEGVQERAEKARNTADFIREQVDKKGMIDVGTGVEKELGISKEKLNQALSILEDEGYPVYGGGIPQVTNVGQQTNQKVICRPGTEAKEIYNYDKVHPLNEDNYTSHDDGETFDKFVYPASMDSKRIQIRYSEDGGLEKDGIVELRRGVKDLSLGESRYSQVRILVDGTHYIKGMAVYSDDLPDGVDIMFNTNRTRDKYPNKLDVLKEIGKDPDNPFGSLIKAKGQSYYTDENGERKLSLINKRADQGDWSEWKDALPSQFLAKQSEYMINKQLKLAIADKQAEYDEICSIPNPTLKKHLLEEFANNCDSAAVHLQAAALPGQKYHVIVPVNTLKDNEIYAPNYNDGDKVALVRYPHGGTFEIPILTVNNKHAAARKLIGEDSQDAVCINKNNADRLSGADFDGDTVMVIPTHDKAGKVKVTNRPPLKGLEGFEGKDEYGADDVKVDADGTKHYYRKGKEYQLMTKKNMQTQMGVVSNLITDMTLGGANEDELAAAVRHSMVVIDAYKHKLDYKQSEIDNNIAALKKNYQIKIDADGNVRYGGASTILSRAKGEESVTKRQGTPKINQKGKEWYDPSRPEGALIYKTADDAYYDVTKVNKRTGEVTTVTKEKTQRSTKMAETDDANTLVSVARNPKELAYADYANTMKALANQSRMEMVNSGKIAYSKEANANYQKEVKSLKEKLDFAQQNAPRERAAQRKANAVIKAKKEAYEEENGTKMPKEDVKKISQQALSSARASYASVSRKKRNIDIEDREWEAIQAGAISENILKQILRNTDTKALKQRAMPRSGNELSSAQVNRIKAMSNSNYTLSQIADMLNVSTTVVSKYLKGAN